jgi:general nucleoside transport system permease protein
MILFTEVLAGGVRGGTSILFAALGETISERAGVVYLGTEGSLLAGALAGYAISSETGHPWLGVLAGAVAGGLLC